MEKRKIEDMPDLYFSKLCEEKYDVNKGVYNTIDCWFYEQGLIQIIERRRAILSFFQYINLIENPSKKVRFGSGGLTSRLEQFWQVKICPYNQKVI